MFHSRFVKCRTFPWKGRVPEQQDRLQNISGDLTLNREKINEIGRETGAVGYRKKPGTLSYKATQLEYGSMDFFRALANKVDPESGESAPETTVTLDDISDTRVEMAAFLTDENDNFIGTIYLPNLRVNGFTINIADPEASIQRTFDLVSEKYMILDVDTEIGGYLAYVTDIAEAGTIETPVDFDVVCSPDPVEYADGDYIFRVVRIRSDEETSLIEDPTEVDADTWSYDAPSKTVTIKDCLIADEVRIWYENSDAPYDTLWANNGDDPDVLLAEYCEIYIKVSDSSRVYRLQTLGIDVKLTRADFKEIGNSEVVLTGAKEKVVTISLDRFAQDFSLEKILADVTGYPCVDPTEFADTIQIMVKIYKEKEHENFAIGYLMKNLSPTTLGFSHAVEDYQKTTNALVGDFLVVSDNEDDIVFD